MKLRYYQKEASRAGICALKEDGRATIVMCCGSGKTIVGVDIANKLAVNFVIVIAPTILLTEQLKKTWESNQSHSVVVFNSDNYNNQEIIEQHIVNKKPIIVITTYNSANLCADIFSSNDTLIDLVIYDEAHRTAGKFETLFNKVVTRRDIKNHLFMTATPRLSIFEDDAAVFFSMDDATKYGNICYNYTLRQAINDNVVTDYKVLVSHVDNNDLRKLIVKDAKQHFYAIALSLKKAIDEYKIKKVITFHSTINDAKKMAETFLEVIPDFDVLHISSSQTGKIRQDNLNKFKKSKQAIITNARCFGEGIDVPDTDAVMFCDEKNSHIDITQNAGRAIRISEDKKVGYIIVPALIDENSNGLGDYANLLSVLHSLSENDETLQETIRLRVNDEEQFRHNLKRFITSTSSSKLSAQEMEDKIYVKVMSSPKSFYDRVEQIKAFIQKNGHCYISRSNCEDLTILSWSKNIRKNYRDNKLKQAHIDILERIGFIWDVNDYRFNEKVEILKQFHDQNKNNLPKKGTSIKYPKSLLSWISGIRERYAKGRLKLEQIEELKKIGFVLNPLELIKANQENQIKLIFEHLAAGKKITGSLNKLFLSLRAKIKRKEVRQELIEKIREYEKQYNVDFFVKIDNKHPAELKKQALDLYISGLSSIKVAKSLNGQVTTSIVANWVKKAGISRDKIATQEIKAKMVDCVINQKMTTKQVAEHFGFAATVVSNAVREQGFRYDKKIKEYVKN